MTQSTIRSRARVTNADVQERGRVLQHTFRVAGIPQYTRWFVEQEPKWNGDASLINRIRRLFNGEGSREDLPLLEKCEVLVAQRLKSAA